MLLDNELLAEFCEAAGVPMKASYRVKELASLLGVDAHTVYSEIEHGHLAAFMPRGCSKGRRVLAREVNRWLHDEWEVKS